MSVVRIATYNIHKCKGMDGKVLPDRVAEALRELDCDIIALQEVVSIEDGAPEDHQARYIAEAIGYGWELGQNREHAGGRYGNVVLSRLPMRSVCNHDISIRGYERRGCLHIDVDVGGVTLHVFNVHLGTSFLERRHQGRRLVDQQILANQSLSGAKIMLGDFNEWTTGLASQLLAGHLKSVDVKKFLRRKLTYPSYLPFLNLDHIYFDERLTLRALTVHRTRTALMASDHLPLVAEFDVPATLEAPASASVDATRASAATP